LKASIVIRTYNEQRFLAELLAGIREQRTDFEHETVLVDSGSTDRTVAIAEEFGCRIERIEKDRFSFGRSLNIGCRAARGECLVFVSGHCIPADEHWLGRLVAPLGRDSIAYTYGCQRGNGQSRFSECQIFSKYFPDKSRVPQEGFYCNNANAALLRSVWEQHPFDEDLTGLEDMHLSKQLVGKGYKVGYVADAAVYHLHDESWAQVRRRFEREAIALQHIMPEIHLSITDFMRYFTSAVLLDLGSALQRKMLRRLAGEIFMYRLMQFWGAYRGNHMHRRLSRARKEQYFYPK
jgi:glycosyltransferase involved in cell wall biosynthesis